MFYNARWYDPALGRFAQADSIVPDPGNIIAWDRYAYVYNQPLKFIDPSGHGACDGSHKVPECQEIDPDNDDKIPFPHDLSPDGEKILDLYLKLKDYYNNNLSIDEFLSILFSKEFMGLNIEWVQHTSWIDPLSFLEHGMTHTAYMYCYGNNGNSICSDLSDNDIFNFIGAYSQSVWSMYDDVVNRNKSVESVLPAINPAAQAVAQSIYAPKHIEWTQVTGNIGEHPAYYGNSSNFSGVPGGINLFLLYQGKPVLWEYGLLGQDKAYVFTIIQAKLLAPFWNGN